MSRVRHRNHGLRKRCRCPRKAWPKCPHSWQLTYKPKGGPHYQLSLDRELGRHIKDKTEAIEEAERIRLAIREGRFRPARDGAASPDAPVTLEQLGRTYFSEYISPKTGETLSSDERARWDLIMSTEIERPNGARGRFGNLAVVAITRHDIDAFRKAHLQPRSVEITDRKGRTYKVRRGGKAGVRGCLGRLRAFYGWAVDKDHVTASPFRKGGQAVKGLFVHEPERERRLYPGEWERLFAAANPHLQALMTAAIETGCRVGELLALRWQQVRFDLNEIHLRAVDTKARRPRILPMSQRLRALLEMRRTDPAGQAHGADAYVFGNEAGEQVKSVKIAWENCRLKAHGYQVKREKNGRLTKQSRSDLRTINLHFHDLRREAGSRFLEGGMPANVVQQFLDHAALSTTSRYLKISRTGMHAAMKRFEEERIRCTSVVQSADPALDAADQAEQQPASNTFQ